MAAVRYQTIHSWAELTLIPQAISDTLTSFMVVKLVI
jgi:hypothetical protein